MNDINAVSSVSDHAPATVVSHPHSSLPTTAVQPRQSAPHDRLGLSDEIFGRSNRGSASTRGILATLNGLRAPRVNPGGGFGHLINGWHQTNRGNCASVAVIKDAMKTYGSQVFDRISHAPDGGFHIRMQDGYNLHLSPQELAQAAQQSHFRGSDQGEKNYANLAFAAMAKRNAETRHHGNFSAAIHDLNTGFNPRSAAKLLGLGHRMAPVGPNSSHFVAYSKRHALFVDGGAEDRYGHAVPYNGTDTWGRRLIGGFTFIPRYPSARYNIVA